MPPEECGSPAPYQKHELFLGFECPRCHEKLMTETPLGDDGFKAFMDLTTTSEWFARHGHAKLFKNIDAVIN